jgi:hypothetical protein
MMQQTAKIFLLFIGTGVMQHANGQAPGWFTKVTAEVGMQVTGTQQLSVADVNNDNYPDIITINTPPGANLFTVRKPVRIYLNTKDPQSSDPDARKFIDITPQTQMNIVPPDTGNHANCFTLADFNNDGNIDIVTGNYYHRIENYSFPNDRVQLYLGDGTGNFVWKQGNGLSAIGLANIRMMSALDYDRDGNLDLFIAVWFKDYSNNVWDHGYLMKGNGDGTFTDVTNASGIGGYLEPMYGAAATDWNNDCYPDIFTAPYCRTGGKLFKNQGNGQFADVAASVGYNLFRTGAGQAACTFSVIPEDVNNDGYMDAFLAVVHGGNAPGQFRSTIAINKGPAENYALEIREDLLPVIPPATISRGDYDGAFIDFDNDGLKDLIMTQGTYAPSTDRTYFWRQQEDHSFKEVTAELGLKVPELKSSITIEAFDFDLDGDDDFLVMGTADFGVWRNEIGNKNNWISVDVRPDSGRHINRSAIGARIYVHYDGKMQMREIMAGRGQHAGQQPFILNFGLGSATHVDSIVVRWPDAACSRNVIYNPQVNQKATVNSFPAGVNSIVPAERSLKLFPNPTTGYVVVQGRDLCERLGTVSWIDVTGKTVRIPGYCSDGDKLVCDMATLPPGLYFLHLTLKNEPAVSYKVVRD